MYNALEDITGEDFVKEFQEYLDTFDEQNKHRDLLWDVWAEATRVAEEKFKSTNKQSVPCSHCEKFPSGETTLGWKWCPWCGRKL